MATGADLDAYHYAGLNYDAETTSDHAQFRQYSSAQGRWMSPDPYLGSYDSSNPQSFNRYSYVLNSPLSSKDQAGLYLPDGQGGGYTSCGSDPNCSDAYSYNGGGDSWGGNSTGEGSGPANGTLAGYAAQSENIAGNSNKACSPAYFSNP